MMEKRFCAGERVTNPQHGFATVTFVGTEHVSLVSNGTGSTFCADSRAVIAGKAVVPSMHKQSRGPVVSTSQENVS